MLCFLPILDSIKLPFFKLFFINYQSKWPDKLSWFEFFRVLRFLLMVDISFFGSRSIRGKKSHFVIDNKLILKYSEKGLAICSYSAFIDLLKKQALTFFIRTLRLISSTYILETAIKYSFLQELFWNYWVDLSCMDSTQ